MDLIESDAIDRQGEQSVNDSPIPRRGETCWRIARADRFALIVDAADYFAAARSAMLKAEHSILLVGWDFDLRIDLLPEGREGGQEDGYPTRLGDFLKAIVRRKPWLRIFILKWDMAVLYTLGNQMLPARRRDDDGGRWRRRVAGQACRERWRLATGRSLKVAAGAADLWSDAIRPQLRDVDVAVARTMPAYEGRAAVREIEELYLAAIRSAKWDFCFRSNMPYAATTRKQIAGVT